MRNYFTLGLIATVVSLLVAGAPVARGQDVFDVIPADSWGLFAAPNMNATGDHIQNFFTGFAFPGMPHTDDLVGETLEELDFGPGVNRDGGLAFVMLDPSDFGVNVGKLAGEAAAGQVDEVPDLPLVIIIAAEDVKAAFGDAEMKEEGGFTAVTINDDVLCAKTHKGYVIASKLPAAVDAVINATASAKTKLGAKKIAMMSKSAFALQVNFCEFADQVGPVLDALEFKIAEDSPAEMASYMSTVMDMYRTLLPQMSQVTFCGAMEANGVRIAGSIDFVPDSPIGKAYAALGPISSDKLMSFVDAGSYIMAMEAINFQAPGIDQQNLLSSMWKPLFKDEKLRDSLTSALVDFSKETTAAQFVIQSLPANGVGLFNVAYIIKCNDSAKVTASMEQFAGCLQQIAAESGIPDLAMLKITYAKAVETVEGASVDAVQFDHPMLQGPGAMFLGPVLGELTPRFTVTAVGKDTVVISLGGGSAMLGNIIKQVVANDGKLMQQADMKDVVAQMPSKPISVLLITPANLTSTVSRAMAMFGAGGVQFTPTSQTPIAIAAGVDGPSQTLMLYVPTAPLKEMINFFMTVQGGGSQAPAPVDTEDF